jgi:hypothetical protein
MKMYLITKLSHFSLEKTAKTNIFSGTFSSFTVLKNLKYAGSSNR